MLKHLQPLIEQSVVRKYSGGSTVYYQGEVPRSASILVSGTVRVLSISAQGDEQIVMYHVPGEFFPSAWIFSKAPGTIFFYEAVTDCELAMVPRDELIEFMSANPARMNAMLNYFVSNFSASLIRINALEQPKARDKLIYTLFYMCQRYGQQDAVRVHLPFTLTHQNLASLVGLTRETTASEINKLKKEKVLTYDSQKYVVNVEKLLELIGEDSLRGLHIKA